MAKKENLPLTLDVNDLEPGGSIVYANEVVAIIAGIATAEVEGIAAMVGAPSANLLGKSRGVTRGVKVEVGTEEVSVDLYVNVEYGLPIQKVAQDAQENVRRAIESMTGLHVVRVDVHVQAVSFEKENNALSAGAKKAMLENNEEPDFEAEAEEPSAMDEEALAEEASAEEVPAEQASAEETPAEETPAEEAIPEENEDEVLPPM